MKHWSFYVPTRVLEVVADVVIWWQHRREEARQCPCDRPGCVQLWDPKTGRTFGGYGPAGCPL